MKGPKFNAKLTRINQESDIALARVLATHKKQLGHVKYTMMAEVLRPFNHTLNMLIEENSPPIDVNEAITALLASMCIEFLHRSVSKGTDAATLEKMANDFVVDFTTNLVTAINQYYGAGLGTADTPVTH